MMAALALFPELSRSLPQELGKNLYRKNALKIWDFWNI